MKLKDLIHLKGEVLIQTVNEKGELATIVDDKNLIVSGGRENICSFLTHTGTSSYIYDVFFGSGGTVVGNSNVALPVASTDTNVNVRIDAIPDQDYTFTVQAETTPSPRAVFSIVIPTFAPAAYLNSGHPSYTSSLNGKAISEIALMLNTSTPVAFAIKRFPSISKSDLVSIIITWTIFV